MRTYDSQSRRDIIQILKNAIAAVRKERINDPGDLAVLAWSLREIARTSEPDYDEDATLTWFDEAVPGPWFAEPLVAVLTEGVSAFENQSGTPQLRIDATRTG